MFAYEFLSFKPMTFVCVNIFNIKSLHEKNKYKFGVWNQYLISNMVELKGTIKWYKKNRNDQIVT
jgi:hypothetical protein